MLTKNDKLLIVQRILIDKKYATTNLVCRTKDLREMISRKRQIVARITFRVRKHDNSQNNDM